MNKLRVYTIKKKKRLKHLNAVHDTLPSGNKRFLDNSENMILLII